MASAEKVKGAADNPLKDAHVRRDALARWQCRLVGLVVVVWLVYLFGAGWADPAHLRHSPGPLARVHATWEADCSACHAPWTRLGPVYGDTHAADRRCQSCHPGAPHHPTTRQGDDPSCVSCHREHRGESTVLSRVEDSHCTRCHSNLRAHLRPGTKTAFENVVRFGRGDHPDFYVGPDPRRLKFSHRRHMTEGIRLLPNASPFTVARVEESARDRYRNGHPRDDSPVQLQCASCHQLEPPGPSTPAPGGLPHAALRPARSPAATMRPVLYDDHCQACHPLTFERKNPQVARSGDRAVRHRLQPAEIRAFLEGHYTEQYLRDLVGGPPRRTLPGEAPGAAARRRAVADIADRVRQAEAELYRGNKSCAECHFTDPPAEAAAPGQLDSLRIVPTRIPQVWFEHAVFDHAAHRKLRCAACHAGAEANAPARGNGASLLPRVETCLECHGPARVADGRKQGGAGHDCTECHRYHHGDAPLHGKGAAARSVPSEKRLNIRQFLNGRP